MAALFTSNDAGCTLAERLSSGGPISVDTAMTLVQTLAEAVQQIHECGRVHLAILPEFVLITDMGAVQLGTIDSKRMLGVRRADRDWLPSTLSSVLPLEIPTEFAAAAQVLKAADLDLDPRSIDIYQLGGLLCRLVTGESPEA